MVAAVVGKARVSEGGWASACSLTYSAASHSRLSAVASVESPNASKRYLVRVGVAVGVGVRVRAWVRARVRVRVRVRARVRVLGLRLLLLG